MIKLKLISNRSSYVHKENLDRWGIEYEVHINYNPKNHPIAIAHEIGHVKTRLISYQDTVWETFITEVQAWAWAFAHYTKRLPKSTVRRWLNSYTEPFLGKQWKEAQEIIEGLLDSHR